MSKVRIRGIYSQSLTQIMLQNHFDVVQPSPEVARRFGLPFRDEIPDVDMWDRSDLQGVVAIAYESVLSRLTDVFRRRLGNVITRTPRVAKGSIYKGTVLGTDEKTGQTKVDLGGIAGLLPEKGLKQGTYIMVQVRAHDYGRKSPVLSSSITIPGKAAVLLPEPVVRLSAKIKDKEMRNHLLGLGERIRQSSENWGILWRTSAERLAEDELRNEIDDLLDTAQQVQSKFDKTSTPDLLFEGTSNADIEFPSEVKEALDVTRAKITPTIKLHHFYKSAGYAAIVELAETIIEERPNERAYIMSKLEKIINKDMPKVDDPINIEHVKLDGRNIVLSKGRVIAITAQELLIRRQFRYTGRKLKLAPDFTEDVEMEEYEGDFAITHAIPGSTTLVTEYFSHDEHPRGTYVNVNTGVEIYPGSGNSPSRIRYIDLEIDVVSPTQGETRIIDQHLLKRAVQRGFITKELADVARLKAKAAYFSLAGEGADWKTPDEDLPETSSID
ncbi:MAG: hypothetical protein C4K47_06780 [Candidatus Thorarchaeota archaeon]|nr:MAG: hypothetical protein C4K47_06780 [Candidatus Thorarchaeota archaeon]